MNEARPQSPPLSGLEYYNLIRHRIEHEDNLVIQRLSWLVASQSFLFTAYALVLNGLTASPQPATATVVQQMRLFHLIPLVAILTCALIYVSIVAAVTAIAGLRRSYRSRFPSDETDLPGIQTGGLTRAFGLYPLRFCCRWCSSPCGSICGPGGWGNGTASRLRRTLGSRKGSWRLTTLNGRL